MSPQRRLRRAGAYGVFGILVVAASFVFWFPYPRVRELLVATASQHDLEVEMGAIGPALGVAMTVKDVSVATRPRGSGKPMRVHMDSARVSLSPLARLFGKTKIDVSARTLGGSDLRISSSR
jgi:type II secretion system protein N